MSVIYSVGHSSQELAAFYALLAQHGVTTLVDVRAYPGSRRHPHFGRDGLTETTAARGVRYLWMPALGGRRGRPATASRHPAWEVDAFRHYADYADSPEFAAALEQLTAEATQAPTAYMCAEALWWQCHRRLISDHLLVAGWTVRHIGRDGRLSDHALPSFARVDDGRLTYDVGVTPPLI